MSGANQLSGSKLTVRPKRRRGQSRVPADSARETLLRAARHLFATRGMSGTSIRDIANAAQMNSSQISYYFKGKEGLYRACVADIAENRAVTANQILRPPRNKEEYAVRLRLYLENMFDYFLHHRDEGLIVIREYDRLHSPAEREFREYFSQIFSILKSFFARAISDRLSRFAADCDPVLLSGLFLGSIVNELRMDHIKKSLYGRSLAAAQEREAVVSHILQLFV